MTMVTNENKSLVFPKALPPSRLGRKHDSLDSFRAAANLSITKTKEYTLVVVTEEGTSPWSSSSSSSSSSTGHHRRILLGLKNRGFGQGFYNSFGGKFDTPKESVEECACRELEEETNISIPVSVMTKSKVGVQHFTSEDSTIEMIVHLFRIHLEKEEVNNDSNSSRKRMIQGCEEITPQWFDDWTDIPLDNMFADDSLWLTTLLSSSTPLSIYGWYHFLKGGQQVNTILHYYMNAYPKKDKDPTSPENSTLEKRLFHALHNKHFPSLRGKEFDEAYAFCNTTRSALKKRKEFIEVVVDVAGGHGALAGLFLATMSTTREAIVIDPSEVGGGGVERAWKSSFFPTKTLQYRYECLRTGLPDELTRILQTTDRKRVLVVACHACQHLSEETLDISCSFGVHVAVMPCCQKDTTLGGSWKSTSKNLSIPIAKVMDLLLAGKIMGCYKSSYEVRMRSIDSQITPQNRIILCRALSNEEENTVSFQDVMVAKAHERLGRTYRKAHNPNHLVPPETTTLSSITTILQSILPPTISTTTALYLVAGFAAGLFTATTFSRRSHV